MRASLRRFSGASKLVLSAGMIAGLFFGLAFGLAGIASAVLGKLADLTGVEFVILACSFLPLLGLLTWFLPDVEKEERPI